jgi:hypothetical protein
MMRWYSVFAKLVELFDAHGVSFVSVTQHFNTTTSMGRLMLNVLLSFAQFEREVTSERIRDKIAASKRKGLWVGGPLPLGYRIKDDEITVIEEEAGTSETDLPPLPRTWRRQRIGTRSRGAEHPDQGETSRYRRHARRRSLWPWRCGSCAPAGAMIRKCCGSPPPDWLSVAVLFS